LNANLSRSPSSQYPLIKGAELYTERGSLSQRFIPWSEATTGTHHYPIASTEFPKDPSTTQRSGAGASSQGAIWDPQEEDTFRRTTPPKERMPAWAYPRMSCVKWYLSGNHLQTPTEPAKPKLTGRRAPSAGFSI
jgi:hypothetical protein